MVTETFRCPACGYDGLLDRPWSDGASFHEICPSCGIQFGYDDAAGGDVVAREAIYRDWRTAWVADGMQWWSSQPPPPGWEPVAQLASDSQALRLDPDAESSAPELPAFLARPEDAPVYHGFPIIESSEVDGFRLGMITDFAAEPDTYGDGFVVAPDNSRAGLNWESEVDATYVRESLAPDETRWGVWSVGARAPLRTEDDARAYLAEVLPELRSRWEAWRRQ